MGRRLPRPGGPDELLTFWGLFDLYREAMDQAGPDLSRVGALEALDAMQYDNGLANPIDFGGDRIGADSVVVVEATGEAPGERSWCRGGRPASA